jgi:hypothetical protein
MPSPPGTQPQTTGRDRRADEYPILMHPPDTRLSPRSCDKQPASLLPSVPSPPLRVDPRVPACGLALYLPPKVTRLGPQAGTRGSTNGEGPSPALKTTERPGFEAGTMRKGTFEP